MLRVLLALEDYGELMYLQTLLKKMGFDVDGVQNERNFAEGLLSLNPEVIVAGAYGKRLQGIDLVEGLTRGPRGVPKVVLLAQGRAFDQLRSVAAKNVDVCLPMPASPSVVLSTLARLGGLNENQLLEKYRRLKATLSSSDALDQEILLRDRAEIEQSLLGEASGRAVAYGQWQARSSMSEEARRERYARAAASVGGDLSDKFDRQAVSHYTKEIRASENTEASAKLEAERQEFIQRLVVEANRTKKS